MDLEHSSPANMSPRKKYSTHFLMSFAAFDSCRKPPANIDLREINSEVSVEEDIPEWRRRASTPSPKNGNRSKNRLSHSLSASFRSQGKEHCSNREEHVSTFPTKNRVAKDATVKLDQHPVEPKGSNPRRLDYKLRHKLTPLEVAKVDNEIKRGNFSASPGASDSETSTELSDQKIDLDTLFVIEKSPVLPMPTAPTLEEIEKDMKVGGGTSGFLTCQDVEKSILTVTEELGSSSSISPREQWPDGEDKVASKHILSLLQRKPSDEEHLEEENVESCKKDLVGELISQVPILSNLEEMLKIANSDSKRDASFGKRRLMYNDTIDSMRTAVKPSKHDNIVAPGKCESFSPATTLWQTAQPFQQQQQHWETKLPPPLGGLLRPPSLNYSAPPNTFLHTRPVAAGMGETPLVPQALQALQRLVDHQLHILNSIPGEVTPGMLHQRLSRSVLGYPATGTHLLLATSGAPAYRFA